MSNHYTTPRDVYVVISRDPRTGEIYHDAVLTASASAAETFVLTCREYAELVMTLDHETLSLTVEPAFTRTKAQVLWSMKQLAAGAPARLHRQAVSA